MEKSTKVDENKKTRKRKSIKDHKTKDGVYAAINPVSYKISQIVNINTGSINTDDDGLIHSGGLVFKYSDKDEHNQLTQEKSIFLEHCGYYFGDMPLNYELPFMIETPLITIEDVSFASITPEHLMKIRQMSMLFTELTFRQIFALDRFIRENMNHKKFSAMNLTVELQ